MLSSKIRTSIITLIAAGSLATAAAAPAVSQAQPREGDKPATCEYNGSTYGEGERISVLVGAHYDNYLCGSDGQWHLVEWHPTELMVAPPVETKPSPVKTITAPVSGALRLL
jgi:hypothetical protein